MTHSKSDLRLAKVALLETRMAAELSTLVRKHGGIPVCVPSVSERPADSSAQVRLLVDELIEGRTDVVVFQTGVSVHELARVAASMGCSSELIEGLKNVKKICRGPKPAAALKKLGLSADIAVPEPHTTSDMIAVLSDMPLEGVNVTVVHHGERNIPLIESLTQRCRSVGEIFLYRWRLPQNTRPLQKLVGDLVDGRYDAVAFTSQIQVRNLFMIARQKNLEWDLIETLGTSVVIAAVGPTCATELRSHGVIPNVVPEHPKMGHMVLELARYMEIMEIQAGHRVNSAV